ncbi:hypothetical protein BU25DRAFT_424617 [Macroventuria anomochaeta]|uniref:Uncharacterized protein n=1 Tax=Macroventuria anomochaeta TaxID=301207 RepID=A0ACB6RP22_9PLEO|nr:uncharacterized protein BU25DRAFT_424617 [Macroventuria anomochaeta]KAF2623641.1 hypothetical protein BU25DRAFT_424617 [Macroventuria anomochaeta]
MSVDALSRLTLLKLAYNSEALQHSSYSAAHTSHVDEVRLFGVVVPVLTTSQEGVTSSPRDERLPFDLRQTPPDQRVYSKGIHRSHHPFLSSPQPRSVNTYKQPQSLKMKLIVFLFLLAPVLAELAGGSEVLQQSTSGVTRRPTKWAGDIEVSPEAPVYVGDDLLEALAALQKELADIKVAAESVDERAGKVQGLLVAGVVCVVGWMLSRSGSWCSSGGRGGCSRQNPSS